MKKRLFSLMYIKYNMNKNNVNKNDKKKTLVQKGLKMIGGKSNKEQLTDIVDLKMATDFYTTGDTLNDFQISHDNYMNDLAMILFYDPKCPHCIKFMDVFKELPKIIGGEKKKNIEGGGGDEKPILFGRVNVTDELSGNHLLSDFFHVQYIPTIYFKNKEYKLYEGKRDLLSLIKYICSETGKCKK
jgi:hypothetical protein